MGYSESDFFMLSALQHYAFCPRQCALIHLDQSWADNYLTVKGDQFHERVDSAPTENRRNYQRVHSMLISSFKLGISGKTDVVEIRKDSAKILEIVPIEYKSGKIKSNQIDELQICAQAICLKEMTGINIPIGFLYYGNDRKRHKVDISMKLRKETLTLVEKIHTLLNGKNLPPPILSKKCKSCSLAEICQPEISARRTVSRYISDSLRM